MADEDQPQTLKSVFTSAERKRLTLENSYEASSPTYLDDLQTAIAEYETCLDLVSRAALFSSNESLEDLSTSSLPYLLITYHLAELHQKLPSRRPIERRVALERARESYETFLGALDSYDLLTDTNKMLYERYTDEPLAFSTLGTNDPAKRRDAKIANFKSEKALKDRLEALRRNPRYQNEDGDDEVARDLHLAHVAYSAHMAFQGLEGINRELEVLAQATVPLMPSPTSVEEDERRRTEDRGAAGYTERLEPPRRLQSMFGQGGPILSTEGKPLQPFTLVGNRQQMTKDVFRPGHNLPTMSIDEYLDEEARRGGIIEGGGDASWHRPEPNEDDFDKADEETMKARAWDEFVEANPKGSGNTLNRG
ncbi:TAP42-like family protein [Colletotrichum paranaense]|uniref:TAP42-like family protein n=7 Tax=Colletotrichum acutatum species complex TaxID=2707335 RepID=A0A9P9XIE7_9PEZI|nr:TAP42-like family protein [Colletotrichum lupini]XP_060353425.1 TAP42-like family protein [Colletotrichum paranaense]XP_060386726.1 TAP42-like family protein [Colletotrichum tamarilloi]XP_060402071.1 TAP42-like family protein [Colletotrichum abscissum]KAI3539551.1 TAP42-like family protein [Colletotrichum filicis]KAK0382191.1 TAP42-like family protein [Colletotrichum limetticola]KAK1447722.1 TAP42-like family protein [Colletotrichum melonis]KXH47215.1 TAP42-like family protein [Colletotri